MQRIKISIRTIKAAIARANAMFDDWQAECCEIAMIPAIAKRYAELNRDRFQHGVAVICHPGKCHKGMTRDDNLAVKDWTEYAGYVLHYAPNGAYLGPWSWNAVKPDYYCHSPSTTWDGMRRETVSQFIHDLRMLALGYDHPETRRSIERAHLTVTGVQEPQPCQS